MVSAEEKELTVCDVMGDWGAYQWSITLFATVYSALLAVTVVVGPVWTPDIDHLCATTPQNQSLHQDQAKQFLNFSAHPHQCTRIEQIKSNLSGPVIQQEIRCEQFVYDDAEKGRVLTNEVSAMLASRRKANCYIFSKIPICSLAAKP